MWAKNKKQTGFTLVELVIVIIVVALLAVLVTVSYNSVQTKTKATTEINDLKAINRALQSYFSENSAYPNPGGCWCGWGQDKNFIPGLVPKYIASLPQQKDTSSGSDNSYIYLSDGSNFKLISHKNGATSGICSVAIGIAPSMTDPARNCWAFGFWSQNGGDGAKWW